MKRCEASARDDPAFARHDDPAAAFAANRLDAVEARPRVGGYDVEHPVGALNPGDAAVDYVLGEYLRVRLEVSDGVGSAVLWGMVEVFELRKPF